MGMGWKRQKAVRSYSISNIFRTATSPGLKKSVLSYYKLFPCDKQQGHCICVQGHLKFVIWGRGEGGNTFKEKNAYLFNNVWVLERDIKSY